MCSSYYFKLLYLYIIYSRLKVLGIFAMNDWTSSSSPFILKTSFFSTLCHSTQITVQSPFLLQAKHIHILFHTFSHKSSCFCLYISLSQVHNFQVSTGYSIPPHSWAEDTESSQSAQLHDISQPPYLVTSAPGLMTSAPRGIPRDCTDPRCTYYPSRIWIHPISVLSIHLGFLALIAQACLSTIICQETSNIYFILSKVVRACELFTVSK